MTSAVDAPEAAPPDRRSRFFDRHPPSPPALILVAALLVSAGVLLTFFAELTFWRDEWSLLLHRPGISADTLLEPHFEHIVVAPVLIYKALLEIFGMDSPAPYQVASVLMFLASISLLYVWLSRRVGGWLAIAGVLPVLFLGGAGDDLLWPFQIGYFGSVTFGIAALLALESERRGWDVFACASLAISMIFSSVGVPFAIAVTALVLTGPDRRRRAYVFLIPVVLFGLWWLGYGREGGNNASLHDLVTSPGYVLDGFSAAASALLGLATPRNDTAVNALDWGRPLMVLLLLFAGLRLLILGRVPRDVWVALAAGLGFWVLASFNSSLFRQPENGRYLFLGVVFLLLLLGALFRGVEARRWVVITALCVSAVAAASNLDHLRQYWNGIKPQSELQRAGLGALELAREHVDPGFQLTSRNADVDYLGLLDAGSYFAAVDSFGSPAFDPEELAASSEAARAAADKVFASALGVTATKAAASAGQDCAAPVGVGAIERTQLELPPEGGVVRNAGRGAVEVALTRYAQETAVAKPTTLAPGEALQLTIPVDAAPQPWRLTVTGAGEVALCSSP